MLISFRVKRLTVVNRVCFGVNEIVKVDMTYCIKTPTSLQRNKRFHRRQLHNKNASIISRKKANCGKQGLFGGKRLRRCISSSAV